MRVNYKSINIAIIGMVLMSRCASVLAATPLVQFSAVPAANQYVLPAQNNMTFYTITNNTPKVFPIKMSFSSPLLSVANTGNACGAALAAHESCVLAVSFAAPLQAQTVVADVMVDYHGRAPLINKVTYHVDADIACKLLPTASYQTEFCQTQYQHALLYSQNLFNPSNTNVLVGQAPGGVIGIFQQKNNTDYTCYLSCGVKALNQAAPTQDTIFELASVTKTFTASILGKKQYLNQVPPLTSVTPYLPIRSWNSQSFSLTANQQPVTFQQLATFSGGVCFSDAPSVRVVPPYNDWIVNQGDFVKDINLLNPDPTHACPNPHDPHSDSIYGSPNYLPSKNVYSNSSFGLLGQALMNIDGYVNMDEGDFNGWMCQHVLTPLNMLSTSGCLPDEAHTNTCPQTGSYCNTSLWSAGDYAAGYDVASNEFQGGTPFPYFPWAPAGGLRSNAVDMVIYVMANLGITNSVNPDAADIVNGMAIAHEKNDYLPVPVGSTALPNIGSQSPLRGNQGYAWVCMLQQGTSDRVCGKIGGHPYFQSFVGFSQSKLYGIVLLLNAGSPATDGSGSVSNPSVPSPADVGVNMINAASG